MSNVLIILYILAWGGVMFFYKRQSSQIDAGTLIIGSYIFYAICSLILWNTPVEYVTFQPMHLLPFIYLFCMLLVAFAPISVFHRNQIKTIIAPPNWIIVITVVVIFICAILCVPTLSKAFNTGGFLKLLSDADAGYDMYNSNMERAIEDGQSISDLFSVLFNAFADLAIFIFFYELTRSKKQIWIICCLGFVLVLNTASPILFGQRGNVVIALCTIIGAYFLFLPFIDTKIRAIFNTIGICALVLITIPLAAITISRFSSFNGGALDSILYYLGQANLYFNNYGLDAGGIRYGDRTINLLKRLIDPIHTPANYLERRDMYPDLKMDDNVFYTFVGDFTLDFGPWIAALIIIIASLWMVYKTQPIEKNTLTLHQILLLYIAVCIAMQGGFLLFAYSDTGGLRLIVLLLYYLALSIISHHSHKIENINTDA